MTPQEIFDRVCDHLARQKKRAVVDGLCQYRTPSGLRCAVGGLIPDRLYDPRMDAAFTSESTKETWNYGGGVSCVARGVLHGVYSMELAWIVDNEDLLADLQEAHDTIDNWESSSLMLDALTNVAKMHNLNTDKAEPTVIAIFELRGTDEPSVMNSGSTS